MDVVLDRHERRRHVSAEGKALVRVAGDVPSVPSGVSAGQLEHKSEARRGSGNKGGSLRTTGVASLGAWHASAASDGANRRPSQRSKGPRSDRSPVRRSWLPSRPVASAVL